MDFLERVVSERQDHDESQRDLAKALDIAQTMVWRYETGKTEMPVRILVAICHHNKVSADYLLGIPNNYRKPR